MLAGETNVDKRPIIPVSPGQITLVGFWPVAPAAVEEGFFNLDEEIHRRSETKQIPMLTVDGNPEDLVAIVFHGGENKQVGSIECKVSVVEGAKERPSLARTMRNPGGTPDAALDNAID